MHRAGKTIETRGTYEVFDEIACGGMATVRLARWIGHNGFSRVVAVKQLYPQFARDSDFVAMFLDEARVSARVRHPNVVPILDIVSSDGDLFLVMDYVHGESVSRLHKLARLRNEKIPINIACTILVGVMHGLHAAHEARTENGEPLQIIHRDVTPQNVLVGVDGCPRILDFGVAQASGRLQTTRDGQLKGKLCYMAPEQLLGGVLDRRVDVYSASAMLWEMLAGSKLFTGTSEGEVVKMVLDKPVPPPSAFNPEVSPALDEIVLRGLQREPDLRFATALEIALAIERQTDMVTASQVGAWVERVWDEALHVRTRILRELESSEKSAPVAAPVERDASLATTSPATTPPATTPPAADEPVASPPVEAADSPDRFTASTRKIVGFRSVPGPVARPVVDAAAPPDPEPPRLGKPAFLKVGIAAVVTVAVALVASTVVTRSPKEESAMGAIGAIGMAAAISAPSQPRESNPPALLVSGDPNPEKPAPPPTDHVPIAKPVTAPSGSEIVKQGKSKTRRRVEAARMAPAPSLRAKNQREPPSLARRARLVRAECNPPFTIDASGIKRMKVLCL